MLSSKHIMPYNQLYKYLVFAILNFLCRDVFEVRH